MAARPNQAAKPSTPHPALGEASADKMFSKFASTNEGIAECFESLSSWVDVDSDSRQISFRVYRWYQLSHAAEFVSGPVTRLFAPKFAISPSDVLATWHSTFWATTPLNAGVPTERVTDLVRRSLRERLVQPEPDDEKALAFLIHAYLLRKLPQRIYIGAPPSMVARLIAGLAAALPRALALELSFSTFEPYLIMPMPFAVVGTWCSQKSLAEMELPLECYKRWDDPTCWGFALNQSNGKQSALPPDSDAKDYAAFASKCLSTGCRTALETFIARIESVGVADRLLLIRMFRDFRFASQTTDLAYEEARFLVDFPPLAAFLDLPGAQRALLDSAVKSGDEREGLNIPDKVRHLAERSIQDERLKYSLCSLAEAAVQRAVQAFEQCDLMTARRLIDDVAKTADESGFPSRFARFLRGVRAPKESEWDHSEWVLRRSPEVLAALSPTDVTCWLRVAPSRLLDLLTLELPSEWRALAVHLALKDSAGPTLSAELLAALLDEHFEAFEDALCGLAANESTETTVLALFVPLLADSSRRGATMELLGRVLPIVGGLRLGDPLLQLVDRVLDDTAFSTFLESHVELLLARLAEADSLRDACRWYLAHLTVERAAVPAARAVIDAIEAHSGMPPSIRAQANAWQTAIQLIDHATLFPDWLNTLAEAADTLGRAHRDDLLSAVSRHLGPGVTSRDQLDLLLACLIPNLVGDPLRLLDALQPSGASASADAEGRRVLLLDRANELLARESWAPSTSSVLCAASDSAEVVGGELARGRPLGATARQAARTLSEACKS